MRVEELMSEARCCRAGQTVRECAQLMKEENIGFVPICDKRGQPIGAITDRDLAIRVLAAGKSADEPIERFMTREAVAGRVGDDVAEAQQLMREHRMSRIMVCDAQGKLVGVISLHDIAEATSETAAGQTLQEVKSDQPAVH